MILASHESPFEWRHQAREFVDNPLIQPPRVWTHREVPQRSRIYGSQAKFPWQHRMSHNARRHTAQVPKPAVTEHYAMAAARARDRHVHDIDQRRRRGPRWGRAPLRPHRAPLLSRHPAAQPVRPTRRHRGCPPFHRVRRRAPAYHPPCRLFYPVRRCLSSTAATRTLLLLSSPAHPLLGQMGGRGLCQSRRLRGDTCWQRLSGSTDPPRPPPPPYRKSEEREPP